MSFVSVLDAVVGCETPVDGAGLAASLRVADRYEARLTLALGEFVVGREWDRDGYANPVQWLKAQGLAGPDAYRMAQTAKKLRRLPVLAAAWVDGVVSTGQVRVILAQVIDRHLGVFAEQEAELVGGLAKLSIDNLALAMGRWRAHADALDDGPEPRPEQGCEATLSSTLEGRGVLNATLDAEGYALAKEALGLADPKDFERSAPERRGDALKEIFKHYMDHQTTKTRRKQRPHVVITVNAATLGTDLPDGFFASARRQGDARQDAV